MQGEAEGGRLRLLNALSSVAVIGVGCVVYAALPVHHTQLARRYGPLGFTFSGQDFLIAAALLYAAAVAVYMLALAPAEASKSLRALRLAMRWCTSPRASFRQGLSADDRVAALATLLKMFFGPMMVMSLMVFLVGVWTNGRSIWGAGLHLMGMRVMFDRFGYWFLMQVILFVDVLIFTVGYLIESRRLGNQIRSVDPTLLGWAVTLVCYPPFNVVTHRLLGSQVSDFPRFDDPAVHLTLNLALLTLMAIYASASVAMGLKASNLTHRGIVARGPYAFVRHPAYVSKNMAWWIGSVPLVSMAFGKSWWDGMLALGSVVAWTLVYVARALTEESHLRRVDGEYEAYAQRVKYRFVPGLY